MGWLKLSFGKGGTAVAERETAESAPEAPSGPPIIVLVNDAAGRAAFKEYVFYDVEAATDWVSYWFPHQTEDGMIAFWAMPDQPGSGLAEPLVIIRDLDRHGVVYMFSFANLTAAEEFIAQETEHGTDADSMVLYWAVPVKREFDHLGKIFLCPSTPPSGAGDEPLLSVEVDRPVGRQEPPTPEAPKEDRSAALEEASNARTGVAQPMGGAEDTFELTSWVHRSRKQASDRIAEDPEPVESVVDLQAPAQSIEPVIEEITAVLKEALEEADGGLEIDALLSEDASGQVVELTSDEVEDLTNIDRPLSEPTEVDVVTTSVEMVDEPFEDEVMTVDSAVLAEPVKIEEISIHSETGAESFDDEVVSVDSAILAEPVEVEGASIHAETLAESFEDELVITDGAAQAEPVEAEAFARANENPTKGGDDEFVPADEPDVPDYDLPEHVVSPTSVNGNGHAHEVTSSLWERAEEIAGNVQYDAPETDASHEEAGKKTIEEVLVNVNVNVNVSDGVRTDVSIDGTNISIRSRALKIKRWEVREEPFEGFNSPPGRF
jgi:hypothetical protein